MSNIPRAYWLIDTAMELLTEALVYLPREKSLTKSSRKSVKMTKAIGDMVRSYKKGHPNASLQEIGEHFGINNGRVSEALNRKKWV